MEKSNESAVLILAAGGSTRLGEPKQLLKYKGNSLLRDACLKALNVSSDIFVVLGAIQDKCQLEIDDLDVKIILNKEYEEGLACSIKIGVTKMKKFKKILIMLCDQPFIPVNHLKKLVSESKGKDKIICSFYKDNMAVPAVFPQVFYKELMSITGDKGAKGIIYRNKHKFLILEDSLSFDIDTKSDSRKLNKLN